MSQSRIFPVKLHQKFFTFVNVYESVGRWMNLIFIAFVTNYTTSS